MFDPTEYLQVRKPLLQAQTLPSHCYTSDAFFHREVDTIFSDAWHFVGRIDEIEQPGDYLILDTQSGSAIVCRDEKNQIQAFINACRHRGTRLKDNDGRCKAFVCPYHAWVYALNGDLRMAKGMDAENFKPREFSLQNIAVQIWGGFIFINFSHSARDLTDWLGDLPNIMQGHNADALRCTGRLEFMVNANWKFLMENALEAYHTGTVHHETLGAQDSESVDTTGQWDAIYVLSDEEKSIATLPGQKQVIPFIDTIGEKAKKGTWFCVVYPCTQLVFSQDCVWWLDLKPVSVDKTKITLGGCFPASSIDLKGFEQAVVPYYERWREATAEDNAIAEAQQRGHQSGLNLPGRFASTEHCVHALDNWVLDRVLSGVSL